MNNNLLVLFKKLNNSYDVIRNLIDNNIITIEQAVDTALEYKNASIITFIFSYIKINRIKNNEIDKKLVNAIIEINNPKHICEFIKYLIRYNECSDLDLVYKFKNEIIKINSLKYIDECFELLCESRDYDDIFYNDINQLAILLIKSRNIDYLKKIGYCYGGTIEMVNEVLSYNDIDYICKFVSYILLEDELLDKIINWVINTNDADTILKFASKTLISCSELEKAIINTNDINNILNFIKHVNCVNESKLSEIVIKYGTKEQILKLKEYLKTKENNKEENNNNLKEKTDLEKIEKLIELTSEINYEKIEELEKNKDIFIELFKEPNKTKKLTK